MKNEEIKINPPRKMGFFKRIQVSIFKVENYGEFVLEKTSVAINYFFKLILIVAIITSIATTVQTHTIVSKGFSYLKNEMPDFTLQDGIISFEEDTTGYDKDLDFYAVFSSKNELSDKQIDELEKDVKKYTYALIYLQDRIIYYDGNDFSAYKYEDIMSEYKLDIKNRYDVVNMFDSLGIGGIDFAYFAATFIASYALNLVNTFFDVVLVLCFAIIASRICGVNIPALKMLSLSIYSLTLSILLSALYTVVYTFTNFYIEYFQVMYIVVAYIYIIASILIIKSDVIKQKLELQKIIEVQKQVKKEIEEQKEEDKDKEKDKEKEKDKDKEDNKEDKGEEDEPVINREPDGSEI